MSRPSCPSAAPRSLLAWQLRRRPPSPAPTRTSAPATRCACSREIQAIPESAIPDKLLDEARAIVVVPDTLKVGLVHRRPPRPRPDVGEESRRHLVQPQLRQAHRRQHRLPGRRAVLRHRAGVPQRPRAGFDRQRQGHPRRRCRRRRRPGRAATPRPPPMASSRPRSGRGRARAACSPASPWTARCCRSTTHANEAVYGSDTTPRMIFEGRATQAPSDAVVDFRDRLEEATAIARYAPLRQRSAATTRTGRAAPAPPARPPAARRQRRERRSAAAAVRAGRESATVQPLPATP